MGYEALSEAPSSRQALAAFARRPGAQARTTMGTYKSFVGWGSSFMGWGSALTSADGTGVPTIAEGSHAQPKYQVVRKRD
ncbi:hypothetical protein GOTRE_007_00330 [Gordonia terrae NBRC 100016]|uniref:Uncharacterized protein n=1 Tax=Gordonia terrae NBRC 100016 TaxID=1089454 RepID=A0ABQ0H874_9ACTN|nr:hypothetical protein GOTRE_007_00330 [Gordonia terrae NBRC 100016]